MQIYNSNKVHNLIILGSGPAGYTAAIYAARALLEPLLISGLEVGGQLTKTLDVENVPGFKSILGPVLMQNMKEHAEHFQTIIMQDTIINVNLNKFPFLLKGEKTEYHTKSLIVATGSSTKWLGIEGEESYKGLGVSACATCDGFFYKNQVVAVVGGGNTAVEEALYLSTLTKTVYLIHRRDTLRSDAIMQEKLFSTPNIIPLWNTKVEKILGNTNLEDIKKFPHKQVLLEKIVLSNTLTNKSSILEISGLFIAIGHTPNTTFLKGHLELDTDGYIKTLDNSVHTSVNGVFAAGDVQDKIYKQAVTSMGSGCMAALEAKRFLDNI